jgi:hypothetical protein
LRIRLPTVSNTRPDPRLFAKLRAGVSVMAPRDTSSPPIRKRVLRLPQVCEMTGLGRR